MVLLVIALFVFEFCGFLLVILGGEWKEVRVFEVYSQEIRR